MKYNWSTTQGKFTLSKDSIIFNGAPTPFTDQSGNEAIGAAFGQIISDQYFSEGKISAKIIFSNVDERSSCEIIFYFDPETNNTFSAGITGGWGMYGIKSFINGKLEFYKQGGDHSNLRPKKTYSLDVILKGTQIKLFIDQVETTSYILPFTLKQSQIGVFCFSQSGVTIKDFFVKAEKPKVFMVMQLSDKYNELYEEVIKDVCSSKDFDLNVVKADEIYGPGVILSDIIKHINESKVVIAEISPVNANVFYEVGYAHALNKPTILIAEKGTQLPFDVSPFRVLYYENTIAGKKRVQESLKKHLDSILNQ